MSHGQRTKTFYARHSNPLLRPITRNDLRMRCRREEVLLGLPPVIPDKGANMTVVVSRCKVPMSLKYRSHCKFIKPSKVRNLQARLLSPFASTVDPTDAQ